MKSGVRKISQLRRLRPSILPVWPRGDWARGPGKLQPDAYNPPIRSSKNSSARHYNPLRELKPCSFNISRTSVAGVRSNGSPWVGSARAI